VGEKVRGRAGGRAEGKETGREGGQEQGKKTWRTLKTYHREVGALALGGGAIGDLEPIKGDKAKPYRHQFGRFAAGHRQLAALHGSQDLLADLRLRRLVVAKLVLDCLESRLLFELLALMLVGTIGRVLGLPAPWHPDRKLVFLAVLSEWVYLC
jgi:hypothetical protein